MHRFWQLTGWLKDRARAQIGFIKVEDNYPTIQLRACVPALLLVLVLEAAIFVILLQTLVPVPVQTSRTLSLSPLEATAGPKGCQSWIDITDYGRAGLAIPAMFPVGDILVTAPVRGSQLRSLVPSMNCSSADASGVVADVQIYNGWEVISGETRSTCTAGSVKIDSAQSDFHMNCIAANKHVDEILTSMRARVPPDSGGYLSSWGVQCSVLNYATANGSLVLFQPLFRWAEAPERLLLALKVWIVCSGLPGLEKALNRSVTPTELASLSSPAGLCARLSPNGQCLVAFFNRSLALWAESPEILMVEVGVIDLLNSAVYGRALPDDLATFQGQGQTSLGPFADEWPQYHTPGGPLAGNASLLHALAQAVVTTHGTQFAELQYLSRSCPGRTTALAQDLAQFFNSTGQLQKIAAEWDASTPYLFTCGTSASASFLQKISQIWPVMSFAHVVLTSYLLKVAYTAIRRQCASEEPDHSTSEVRAFAASPVPKLPSTTSRWHSATPVANSVQVLRVMPVNENDLT